MGNIKIIEYQLVNYKYEIYLNNKKDSLGRGSVLISYTGEMTYDSIMIDKIIMTDINDKLKLNDNYSIVITDKEILSKNIYNINNNFM